MFLTFLSDLGVEDPFLGLCKGVIARIAPDVRVLDVLHSVAAQDVEMGATMLASSLPFLPAPAVHLAVVDPFRTIPARGIAVRTADGSLFVAPDNGLTSQAWDVAGGAVEAHVLDDETLWNANAARTFRARDVFSPVAARLADGLPIDRVGSPVAIEDLERLELREARLHEDHVHGEIAQVDHFGNLTLNMQRHHVEAAGITLGDMVEIRCGGKTMQVCYTLTYGEVPAGRVALCEDSFRTMCVAVNQGSAAARLRSNRGEPIVIARVHAQPPAVLQPVRVYDEAPSTVTA
ncbi:MAG: S-adenosyl-l-methionine hydroxide adenosyltransferase family protein [Mycobacteriales bacterium]